MKSAGERRSLDGQAAKQEDRFIGFEADWKLEPASQAPPPPLVRSFVSARTDTFVVVVVVVHKLDSRWRLSRYNNRRGAGSGGGGVR